MPSYGHVESARLKTMAIILALLEIYYQQLRVRMPPASISGLIWKSVYSDVRRYGIFKHFTLRMRAEFSPVSDKILMYLTRIACQTISFHIAQ